MAEATLFVRHPVEEYGAWRAVYETVEPLRQQHGCTGAEVLVDPTDQEDVFIIHRFPSVAQAEAFASSDELRDAMGRAGVAGPPRVEIAVGA
jgi:quinol monooxygenase YgiN